MTITNRALAQPSTCPASRGTHPAGALLRLLRSTMGETASYLSTKSTMLRMLHLLRTFGVTDTQPCVYCGCAFLSSLYRCEGFEVNRPKMNFFFSLLIKKSIHGWWAGGIPGSRNK